MKEFSVHNQFKQSLEAFQNNDPQLSKLQSLSIRYHAKWWHNMSVDNPGIYILTGGRQIGKSTSCKLLIEDWIKQGKVAPQSVMYLPCDEVFDAKQLSQLVGGFINEIETTPFLLIIDEVTFVPNWERVIKSLADSGAFAHGICLLTGSDTLILKKAAMSFPGRRGNAEQTDYHLYPLGFRQYADLVETNADKRQQTLQQLYVNFLKTGGYLRAINDMVEHGEILTATYNTYEQWVRGDFLKQSKNEDYLLAVLNTLLQTIGSQVSYSGLTQKTGLMSKETFIDYCHILERMDIIFSLKAFDQNNKRAFPKKAMKMHCLDPFIANTLQRWLMREGLSDQILLQSELVEATVAAHCNQRVSTFYYKAQGEVDVLTYHDRKIEAIEVKWANQLRPSDLKTLKHFDNAIILKKSPGAGTIESIDAVPVYQWLYDHGCG